ncbi:DnaJ domain protein [Leptospira inadai serovar Lyme str. 10]|uniref:DnaJ domain protein n=2 Tax=Leptospira inadai serovar Lyme TaxID=293084 RepID=V6HZ68_9LEPT|nr:DnaJ domain-containing protein [Leptospira inadai]EQA38324.1 DnaJ domain protein [Leptospira inadai serovar Lyme str. 10]PNV74462.1 molecular chaperone DnaJ [Leptospira inadai serovar Lyme]
MNRKADYYGLLGLPRDAEKSDIEEAFDNYISSLDMNMWVPWRTEALREGAEAYYFLSDPIRRKRYDGSLDYELVLLDPNGVPKEFEQYFEIQKITTPKEYQRLYHQFLLLKYEREDKLWSLRNTTLFFLGCFSFLMIVSLVLVIFQKNGWLSSNSDLFYRKWGLLLSSGLMGGGYLFFRVLYLNRILSKRERKREQEIDEESRQA